MKNITLKFDEAVLARVRHAAVDEQKSVSGWVQDVITRELSNRDRYEQDRKRALLVLREGLTLGDGPLSREDSHTR